MKSCLVVLCAFCIVATVPVHAQTNQPMKLVQTIELPNVEGYFDHMAVDVKGQRLFLPGENQRTIEVIDLRAGKVIRTITGFVQFAGANNSITNNGTFNLRNFAQTTSAGGRDTVGVAVADLGTGRPEGVDAEPHLECAALLGGAH